MGGVQLLHTTMDSTPGVFVQDRAPCDYILLELKRKKKMNSENVSDETLSETRKFFSSVRTTKELLV